MPPRSPEMVSELLRSKSVVELADVRAVLGGASRATAFRYLKQVPYRSSYNHNGRYFTLDESDKFDRNGLYSVGDIHFSREGTVKATVVRMVREAEAGCSQRELQERLRIRVRTYLLAAVREGAISRERVDKLYLYLHGDPEVRAVQLERRHEPSPEAAGSVEVGDGVAIRVLLVLLRHPGALPGDVVRHLRSRSPPIARNQVDAVFSRFGLGEKGGPRIY